MGKVLHPVKRGGVGLLHVVLVHLDDLVVAVELDAHLPLSERLPCLALLDLTTRSKTISEKLMGEILYSFYPIMEKEKALIKIATKRQFYCCMEPSSSQ